MPKLGYFILFLLFLLLAVAENMVSFDKYILYVLKILTGELVGLRLKNFLSLIVYSILLLVVVSPKCFERMNKHSYRSVKAVN